MSQQSIDCYYGHRKRKGAADETAAANKVIILDRGDGPQACDALESGNVTPTGFPTTKGVKLLSNKKDILHSDTKTSELKCPKSKAAIKLEFDDENGSSSTEFSQIESKNPDGSISKKFISFKKAGALSPKKKSKVGGNANILSYMMKLSEATGRQPSVITPSQDNVNMCKDAPSVADSARKELSLGNIKKCLNRSSRLNELRASISRLNQGFDKLKELNEKTPQVSALKEFKSIELMVPVSPSKQSPDKLVALSSPAKDILMSPRKAGESPVKSPKKIPAYQRHASLAERVPSLTIPHHYRFLAEVFRDMETVCSMLFNRKETITFTKVRPAVQEMLRRNVTEKHLGQIKNISPLMYTFSHQKIKNFGATAKKDEYELVITPNFVNQNGVQVHQDIMNPTVILERRAKFFKLLVEKVKDHHAVFLHSLDPPMDIQRDKIQRWHPEFDLEHIPEVEVAALPELPNVERYSTAQDVLSHVRDKFNCNTRMNKALEKLAAAKARGLTSDEQKATGLNQDGSDVSNANAQTSESSQQTDDVSVSASGVPLINPALKGVPKALLEKIRARQAAKALESMTRSSAYDKDLLIYQKLPDLAHLIRNLFVTEKKNVLPLELVIAKLDNSFKLKVSSKEMTSLIHNLSQQVPGWLTFHQFSKVDHLKIVKDMDMNKIITKLKNLIDKHSKQ